MRSPDEIKKGLECGKCSECSYNIDEYGCTWTEADALAYIQQLEDANTELITKVKQLEAKCHQLKRERDVLVEAIRDEGGICFTDTRMPCRYCDAEGKYAGERCHYCHAERPFGGFNWRGVKED